MVRACLDQELIEDHLQVPEGPGLEVADLTSLYNSLSRIVSQDIGKKKKMCIVFSYAQEEKRSLNNIASTPQPPCKEI